MKKWAYSSKLNRRPFCRPSAGLSSDRPQSAINLPIAASAARPLKVVATELLTAESINQTHKDS
jgi:hypothetical protein